MALKRISLLLSALLFALLAPATPGFIPVFAADTASEQAVRAALVFNFIKFTELPALPPGDSELRVCIATSDPAQVAAIEALGERQVRGMPLVVVRFNSRTSCSVIYVDSSQRWNEIAERRSSGRALTIGGYAGFVAAGGMIEISLQDSGARFDVNLLEAKRAGLRIYPQLLRLAHRVVE